MGSEYRDFIMETFSDIACMVARWYHFETRVLNLQDPALVNIQDDIGSFKEYLTELFFLAQNIAATIHIYTNSKRIERFGNPRTSQVYRRCKQLIIVTLGQRITARKTEWQDLLKGLKTVESKCKTCTEVIDLESKFQENNGKILSWITTEQKLVHQRTRERLGVDEVYQHCGEWLFQTAEYCEWKEFREASKSILWLRGTGMWFPRGGENPLISGSCLHAL